MDVEFCCYLSAPAVEKHERRAYLEEFLSDISGYLQVLGQVFAIVWGDSPLAPEPNYLLPYFVDGEVLILPFSFQHFQLERTCLKIDLPKKTFENLTYKRGVEVVFEYHLDE